MQAITVYIYILSLLLCSEFVAFCRAAPGFAVAWKLTLNSLALVLIVFFLFSKTATFGARRILTEACAQPRQWNVSLHCLWIIVVWWLIVYIQACINQQSRIIEWWIKFSKLHSTHQRMWNAQETQISYTVFLMGWHIWFQSAQKPMHEKYKFFFLLLFFLATHIALNWLVQCCFYEL